MLCYRINPDGRQLVIFDRVDKEIRLKFDRRGKSALSGGAHVVCERHTVLPQPLQHLPDQRDEMQAEWTGLHHLFSAALCTVLPQPLQHLSTTPTNAKADSPDAITGKRPQGKRHHIREQQHTSGPPKLNSSYPCTGRQHLRYRCHGPADGFTPCHTPRRWRAWAWCGGACRRSDLHQLEARKSRGDLLSRQCMAHC